MPARTCRERQRLAVDEPHPVPGARQCQRLPDPEEAGPGNSYPELVRCHDVFGS